MSAGPETMAALPQSADGHPGIDLAGRRLPPIGWIATLALVLVVIGGIYLGAYLPQEAPMGPAYGLIGAAALVLALDAGLLMRIRPFAWRRFRQVGGWVLAAYSVIAGMLELTFVLDGIRGGMLTVLTLTLLVFAVSVPMIVAFTVARYQDPD